MKPANAQAEVAVPGRRRSADADQPVFVAEHRWRERSVRAVLALLAALLVVWLLALIAGALGLGSLPPLPISTGGDTGSASSRSEPPAGHPGVAPGKGTAPPGSPATSRSAGQPVAVPTRQGAHGFEDAPASVVANPDVVSHSAGKGSGGGGQTTAGEPASQQAGANRNTHAAAGSRAAEAPAPPAAHGPPALTPSGNEVPTGAGGAPSAKAEALAESPGGAHGGASETRRPG
jgi:hypothetical protein